MSLYEIIKSLQAAKGSKEKQAILCAQSDNSLLKAYLRAVYDPALSYYIKKLPKNLGTTHAPSLDESVIAWLVDCIAGRKITGTRAMQEITGVLECTSKEGNELVQLVFDRSIGAGVGDTLVLNAFPGLYFIPPYMRCAGVDQKALNMYNSMPYFFIQTKMDGSFAYLSRAADGTAKLFTRAGTMYPTEVAQKLAVGVPVGFVLMGELLVLDNGSILDRKTGNGILNSVLKGEDAPDGMTTKLVAWDMVTQTEFVAALSERPYEARWEDLLHIVSDNISTVKHTIVGSLQEAFAINTANILEGQEGSVVKNPNGLWRNTSSGTRDAVKLKVEFEADYKITGAYEGSGKASGMLGGFSMASADDRINFNVGSGFSDRQRKDYWEILKINSDAFNDTVATVKANEIISNRLDSTLSLFLPIFVELRLDKLGADTYQRVVEQLESAKMGKDLLK